jgi:hypothetical protein
VNRRASDCFQKINVRKQEFGVLWCGQGLRYTFTKEVLLRRLH